MGKLNEVQEKYKRLLCKALQLFYVNDAKALFNEPQENAGDGEERKGWKRIVNERAMAGCVYRYMWCLMQQAGDSVPVSDIDIEYDRMVKDDLHYYEKELFCDCEKSQAHGQCGIHAQCYQVIANTIKNNENHDEVNDIDAETADGIRKAVRPDIIVHNRNKRGRENNGLVVEFKKDYKGLKYDAIAFDIAKLYYFTCPQSKSRQYMLGAMVILRSQYSDVGFIVDQKILGGCKVCANDIEEIATMEIEAFLMGNSSRMPKCLSKHSDDSKKCMS